MEKKRETIHGKEEREEQICQDNTEKIERIELANAEEDGRIDLL